MTLLFKMTSAHPDRPHTHNARVIMRDGVNAVEVLMVHGSALTEDDNLSGLNINLASVPKDMLYLPVVMLGYEHCEEPETIAMCGDIYLSSDQTGKTLDKILRRDYDPLLHPSPVPHAIVPALSVSGWDNIEGALELAVELDLERRGEAAAVGEISREAICDAARIWNDDRPIRCTINHKEHVLLLRDLFYMSIFDLAGVSSAFGEDEEPPIIGIKNGDARWTWHIGHSFNAALYNREHLLELTVPAPPEDGANAKYVKAAATPVINYAGNLNDLNGAVDKSFVSSHR